MVKRNIDLIEHEIDSLNNERICAYNELQWRAGFAISLIVLFCVVFGRLGGEGPTPLSKYFFSAGFIAICLSVGLCFFVMAKLGRDTDYTEFEEKDWFERSTKEVEFEVLERKYVAYLNIMKAVGVYAT